MQKRASQLRVLAFSTKKKFKFHCKHYSDKAKDIIFKIADSVKLATEKPKHSRRLDGNCGRATILSETAAEQTCAICKISEFTFYRTSKSKKEIQKNIDEEQKVDKNKILLDDFDKPTISRILLSFYLRPKPELPTFEKIHN